MRTFQVDHGAFLQKKCGVSNEIEPPQLHEDSETAMYWDVVDGGVVVESYRTRRARP